MMTPEEFKAIKARLGLSIAGMARLLGCDPMTVKRMANGSTPIRKPVRTILRALEAGKISKEEVR